ncbi:MAG: hypothetical protein AB8I08_16555, partial [Sandaracinaceae bacterium]
DVARALLVRGSMFVYLDPRREEVSVPPWFRKQAQLVLQFGLQLPVPIPDMRVDEEGVFGTLSFNRQPFVCEIPWSGVFALVGDDGMGMVWEEDLPEEIAAEVEAGFRPPKKRPSLRAIEGGRASEDPSEPASPSPSSGGLVAAPSVDDAPRDGASREGASREGASLEGASIEGGSLDSAPPDDAKPDGARLEAVGTGTGAGADRQDGDDPDGEDDPPRPHLRLIK